MTQANPLLDIQLVELEIARLLEEYPEMAEDEELRADMIEGGTAAYDVLDRVLTRIRDAESDANAVADRIEYLSARQDAARHRGAVMRRLALRLMAAGDLKSIKLPEGTLSRVKGRESVSIEDESLVPAEYVREKITYSPDKTALKAALLAGTQVPGASIVVGEETLQVR